jgi:transcriptional regulator with XRE-family HTH domain
VSQVENFVGAAVRHARTEQGLSQEQLALVAGLDRTYISGVERSVRNPTIASLATIARALDRRLSELIAVAEELAESA